MRYRTAVIGFSLLALVGFVASFRGQPAPRAGAFRRPAAAAPAGPVSAVRSEEAARAKAAQAVAPIAAVPGRELAMRDGAVAAVFTPRGLSIRAASGPLGWTANLTVVGARDVEPRPEGQGEARVHHLVGRAAEWAKDLPSFSAARYPGIREGVDLLFEARPRGVEYSFHVAPGADASEFRMRWEGTSELRVSADAVEIVTGLGTLRESGLIAYQDGPAGRELVPARYRAAGPDSYAIELGAYDPSRPLVVDPTISWATYVGGAFQNAPWAGADYGRAIAADAAGNTYVVGSAGSTDMATPGAYDRFNAQNDSFVSKIKADGTGVAWTSYVGPAAMLAIAVDAAGYVHVTGFANEGFPVVGGVQPVYGGNEDAVVLKLTPDGSNVWFSTYLGGLLGDAGKAIAVDAGGNVYVAGFTSSLDFPGPYGYDSGFHHLGQAFVTKLNSAGSAILWSSRIGGSDFDEARGLGFDPSGNVVVSGQTRSANFPVTAGVVDAVFGGESEAFVLKLNAAGSALLWSTFLGGSDREEGDELAVDAAGNVYTVGMTTSFDFPLRGAFQAQNRGPHDLFVSKLNPTATAFVWSSYFGGSGDDHSPSLAIDANRNVLVAGGTNSSDLPLLNAFRTQGSSGEGFVAKIRAAGTGLLWCSLVGGSSDDYAADVAVDAANNVYLTGETNSPDFATANAFDTTRGAAVDAFVLKTGPGGALRWASYLGGSLTHGFETIKAVAVDGSGAVYVTGDASSIDYPATAGVFGPSKAADADNLVNLDAVVSKFGADGALLWSTYLGGTGHDSGRAIAVDSTSHVYVVGVAESWDFPATPGSLRDTTDGHDGFVAKIDPLGATLVWSTFLGGLSGFDVPRAVALDGSRNVIVAGQAGSGDFPVLNGYDTTFNGWTDGFVSKIAASGSSLLWSTLLGGGFHDDIHAITKNAMGDVFVTGETQSADFPVSGWDATHNGNVDAFVAKLSSNGRRLDYSTLLGGSQNEVGRAIAVDTSNNVTVAGETSSFDFPTTASAFDRAFGGATDGFVARFNSKGTSLTWSTFLGGDGTDLPTGLALDASKNAYVTGLTMSSNFPLVSAFDSTRAGFSDAFVTKIVSAGTGVAWSSLLGGSGSDEPKGLAISASGHVVLVGNTDSPDLATPGAFDPFLGGIWDGFVARIAP